MKTNFRKKRCFEKLTETPGLDTELWNTVPQLDEILCFEKPVKCGFFGISQLISCDVSGLSKHFVSLLGNFDI